MLTFTFLICSLNFWSVGPTSDLLLLVLICFYANTTVFCCFWIIFVLFVWYFIGCFSVRIVILFLVFFCDNWLLFFHVVVVFLLFVFLQYLQLFFSSTTFHCITCRNSCQFFFNCFLSFFLPPFWSVKLFFLTRFYTVYVYMFLYFQSDVLNSIAENLKLVF